MDSPDNNTGYTRIFLLSHMRAMTSLAGHIIGSHPAINGYYEMHISYGDASALDRQIGIYQQNDALKNNSRYVFDKLLHNEYVLNLDLPELARSKVLVSILEPEHAIRSIVDLFSRKAGNEPYASPAAATSYYIERMQLLADFCQTHKQHYFYDAEMLRQAPESLLPVMSDWLELDPPLSEHYQVFNQTGKARKGDTSSMIKSGNINRTPGDYSHVNIDVDLLARAQDIYQCNRRSMIESAIAAVVSPATE